MLRRYEDGLREIAAVIESADRDTRAKLVDVTGREEKFTEQFLTRVDERLNGLNTGGLKVKVLLYSTDKQSGQEKRTGADWVGVFRLRSELIDITKGFLAQSKINKNKRYGMSVSDRPRLNHQSQDMLKINKESYVFGFGQAATRVVRARSVIAAKEVSLSEAPYQSVTDFFFDVFMCKAGSEDISANSQRELQELVKSFEAVAGMMVDVRENE